MILKRNVLEKNVKIISAPLGHIMMVMHLSGLPIPPIFKNFLNI